MISRCGIDCSKCEYKDRMNCSGCHATKGHPFWGECRLAKCSIDKGINDCSKCEKFACELLKEFAYDKEQGDDGLRIRNLEKFKNN